MTEGGTDEAEHESERESEHESEYETDTETEYESDTGFDPESEFPIQLPINGQVKFADLFHWILILFFAWHIAHNVGTVALSAVLQVISKAFSTIEVLCSPVAVGLSAFPATIYLAYKYLKIDSENYVKHVLCPKCHCLYNYDEMLKANQNGSLTVKRCTHIAYPDHPQRNRRLHLW